jgi:uncharacterized protein (TIRG00374 family)
VAERDPQRAPTFEEDLEEEMPRVVLTRRKVLGGTLFVLLCVGFLYLVLPRLSGLDDTWNRIDDGDPWWLALAVVFTVLSFGGYVAQFRGVYTWGASPEQVRIGFAESYQITMAGLAATRIFGAGGAGGIALTAWALRRAGMSRIDVADRTFTFLVLTYAVYMAALVVGGVGLYVGLLEGPAPFSMTIVPAIFGAIVFVLCFGLALTPTDLHQRMARHAEGHGRTARLAARLATLPATMSAGVRHALEHLRSRDPAVLGSIAYWGFNIAILWACFRAFGESPPWAVIVMAYFVGMLGNLLPLPGGVGGVDGGMIGALAAFGVDVDLAIVAVLSYRALAFWLPTIPGAIAYFQLRKTVARWREELRGEGAPARHGQGTILSEA